MNLNVNISFHCYKKELEQTFLEFASKHNILGLKGHKLYGGLRASIYNAISLSEVQQLIVVLKQFESKHL